MKVLIVNNMEPFLWGGAEELAENLRINLIKEGHEAEILRIPFDWDPASKIPSQISLVRNLELTNVDKVIALKFPAYMIRHPKKTVWLLHQFRQAYDLKDNGHSNIPDSTWGFETLKLIKGADDLSFDEAEKIFCNSSVTRDRLRKYNSREADVLLPPVNNPEMFCSTSRDGFIFSGGRVNSMKRQLLLLEALKLTRPDVKLVIAGPPDSESDAAALEDYVSDYGLGARVKLDLRFLNRNEYADYVNRSNAVAYIPLDEDSYGYVAMEAAQASKPVITTSDSGGVAIFIENEKEGIVAKPTPSDLARAFEYVFDDDLRAIEMGNQAFEKLDSLGLHWSNTIQILLA